MRVILSAGKKVYFTLLASSFMFPVSAFAQCVENENCAALGYDSTTSCDNGIKCPFGEYWACREPAKPEEPEAAVLGQCNGYAKNCNIADILYSDGTCSADVVSSKTPIAVVVYISRDGCGQALALEELGNFIWSTEQVDIPDLPDYSSAPTNDFDSCENTKIVIDYSSKQYGNKASGYYHAFWWVYNYAPSTMPETKGKWCLPAGGILNSIYQNSYDINQSLIRLNKEAVGSAYWSSSEYLNNDAWYWQANTISFFINITNKISKYNVRPVIEF